MATMAVRYAVLVLALCYGCNTNGEIEDSSISDATESGTKNEETGELTGRTPHNFREILPDELASEAAEIPGITSFILFQNGQKVVKYFSGTMGPDSAVNIKSASKSIMSALIGIAIEEGYINSPDDRVEKYIPGYFENLDEPEKSAITIRHLLTMSSGLESTSFRNYGSWVNSNDWVAHKLNGPLNHNPGEHMRYSTGDTHLLSVVLAAASGMSARRFAQTYLFDPINQNIKGWDRDPSGYYFGGNNMSVSPEALLKFGRLYLEGGSFEGKSVIPPDWLEESFTVYFDDTSYNYRDHDYGLLWWRNEFQGYESWFAWGYGGQYLFVLPDLDALAVFTSNPESRAAERNDRIYEVMENMTIPLLYHNKQGF